MALSIYRSATRVPPAVGGHPVPFRSVSGCLQTHFVTSLYCSLAMHRLNEPHLPGGQVSRCRDSGTPRASPACPGHGAHPD